MDAGQIHQLVAVAAAIGRHAPPQQLRREAGPIGDLGIATGQGTAMALFAARTAMTSGACSLPGGLPMAALATTVVGAGLGKKTRVGRS